jgi:hypothetical protein
LKKPGKRALRAEREARRAELAGRLADQLRALGLGASAAPGLIAHGERGEHGEIRQALAAFSGNTEGDQRRRETAERLILELAALGGE